MGQQSTSRAWTECSCFVVDPLIKIECDVRMVPLCYAEPSFGIFDRWSSYEWFDKSVSKRIAVFVMKHIWESFQNAEGILYMRPCLNSKHKTLMSWILSLGSKLGLQQTNSLPSIRMPNSWHGQHLVCHPVIDGVRNLYGYQPSLAAGVFFSILFTILMIFHVVHCIRRKTWWCMVFAIGCLGASTHPYPISYNSFQYRG